MRLNARQIDSLEDLRIISLSKAQGMYGIATAKKYANLLFERASIAFAQSDLEEALWLSEREFNFNCAALGFRHPFTRSCYAGLKALRRYKRSKVRPSHLSAVAA